MNQLQTPVAFFIYNRAEVTQKVFAEIRRARPKRLLVVADGPRPDRPDDAMRCSAARRIIGNVDWPCEVSTKFSDVNLGCKKRVSSGLDWIFTTVERAIILEDDCLPDPTFFRYCEELLEKYRDDERIFHISGDHFRVSGGRRPDSYYFSRFSFIWGWATWRRAWKYYDVDMNLWPLVRDGGWLRSVLGSDAAVKSFTRTFESVYHGSLDTWDIQWGLTCWMQNGLSIRPHVNLVSNIGFDQDATHTTGKSVLGNLPTDAMAFPMDHPPLMMPDGYEDRFSPETLVTKSMWRRAEAKVEGLARRALSLKTNCKPWYGRLKNCFGETP